MRYLFIIAFFAVLTNLHAQDYELSEQVNLPLTGWNKVLQASNGNTLLFHLEARKPMTVKVFNKERKEIASVKYVGKVLDMQALERSELHGVYEINGEAVLFIGQAIYNKETLVRVCFNTETGKLTAEKPIIESQSFKKRLSFSLVRNKIHGGYAVFCMKDLVSNFTDDSFLEVFDEQHNIIRRVVYPTNRKEYDETHHVSTCIGNDGAVAVMFNCNKIINYPKISENSIVTCYLGHNDTTFTIMTTKLPQFVGTDYGMFSYDDFAKRLNVFMVGATTIVRNNGLQKIAKPIYSHFMLRYLKEDVSNMDYSAINYSLAAKQLTNMPDSNNPYRPMPMKVYTNKYGLNTLVSEDIKTNLVLNGVSTSHTYIGDVVVTQINEEGREIWSTILPKRQFIKNQLSHHSLRNRNHFTNFFRYYDPNSDWLYQFSSFNSYMTPDGNYYIIQNDHRNNFAPANPENLTPVSTYAQVGFINTDAVYYKITKKREVTKHYVIEPPATASYAAMLEGADFNEANATYSALFVENDGGKMIMRMGWRKLN